MKKWQKNSIIIIVMVGSLSPLYAKNSMKNSSLTWEEVLKFFLENNISIQGAKNEYKMHLLERHNNENAYFLPTSSVNVNYTPLHKDDEKYSHFASSSWECGWNVKKILRNRWKRKIGRLSSHIHNLYIEVDINQKIETLIYQFYELAFVQKKKEITNKFLERAKKTAENIKIKYKIGKASKLEYLDAQATYYNRKGALLAVDKDLKLQQHNLNILLSKKPYNEICITAPLTLSPCLNTTAIIKSIENNIQIVMRNKEIEQAKITLQEKKWNLLPSFSIGIQSTPFQYILHPVIPDDALTSSLRFGINITWNLKPLFLFPNELQKEKIRLHNAKLYLSDTYLHIELLLQNKIAEYTCLFTRHTTLKNILALKKEKLALNKERHRLGKITLLELQTEEEKTKDIEIELVQTIFEIKKLETSLKNIIGESVPLK